MPKTLVYITILLLLGFGVYFFIIKPSDDPYTQAEAGFTIKDTASIGKIFIASPGGEAVTVERTDSGWYVNRQYKALKSTLDLLLHTLNQQTALYPVTKNALDNAIKTLSTDGIKVELYDRENKKMRVFYVGGTAVNNSGTNMLMDGASTPYVVQAGSFNGALTPRYTPYMKDWRDRTVFNIPAEEIKSVSINYAGKPLNSFEIKRERDTLTISADPEIANHLDGPNLRRAGIFLKYFTNVNCEGYLNGLPDNQITISTAPKQSAIEVTDTHGRTHHLDIYWMALNKRSKNRVTANPDIPDNYDADRLYAVINDYKDTVMIQQWAFRDIFHKAHEFFQKDGTPTKNDPPQHDGKNVLIRK